MSNSAVFDQSYYLSNNADVVVAISQGHFANALDHFNQFGGKELRQPNATFNPSYYAINNADVLNAVSSGVFANVFAHYQSFGETENRAPNTNLASFDAAGYLAANADVAAAITAGSFSSALDHYIAFGQNESREGSGVTASVETGQSITLTSRTDSGAAFTGGASQDAFSADLINESGVANVTTINSTDVLDGGAGNDTLTATYDDNVAATISNIETLTLSARGGGTGNTFDFVNVTGVTQINSTANTAVADFNNIQAIPTLINVTNNAQNVDVDMAAAAVTGTTDTLAMAVSGNTAGNFIIDTGIETVTIASNGTAANTIADLQTTTGATALTITGGAALTITASLDTAVVTVDGSAATGVLTLTQSNAGVSNISTGSANDVLNIAGTFVDGTTAASADTITMGEGTDRLLLNTAEIALVGSAAQFSLVTGVEQLVVQDDANGSNYNMNFLTGVNQIEFDALVGAHTLTATSGSEIQFDAADNNTDARNYIITGTGTDDSLTFDINGVDIGDGTQTTTGIETLNMAISGTSVLDGAITMTATAAQESLVITGTGTSFTTGNITADVVNVSGYTGTFITGVMQAATQFSGSSGADTVTGSTAADILQGNGGADTIRNTASGAAANAGDILSGGDGNDTFILSGDTASGALSTILGTTAHVSDYAAGDIISYSLTEGNYTNAQTLVESIAQAASATAIQTVAQNATAAAYTGGVDLVKLTTAVAGTGTLQQAFNTAIGTATLTGFATANDDIAFSLYDSTNERALFGIASTGNGNTVLATADVVSLIGSVTMTAAEYAAFDNSDLSTTAA